MEATLKDKLQEILNYHFNLFLEENINGEKFSIMPPRSDIPKIIELNYNNHSFVLLFESKNKVDHKEGLNELMKYYKDNSNSIIGIEILIKDKSNIKQLKFNLLKTISEEIKSINSVIDSSQTIRNNISKRKLHFFKDLVESNIEELIKV